MFKSILHYYKPHKKMFLLDIFCATLVCACNLFYPSIARKIINDYVPDGNLRLIVIWASVLLGVFVLKAGLNYIIGFWGHMVGVHIQGDMRRELFAHLQKLPLSYYDETKIGQIMSRLVNDLFEVSELAHHGPEDIILSVLTLVGAIIMIITINPYLALIVVVVLPLLILLISKTRHEFKAAMKLSREKTAEINADVENSLLGIRVTKGYTAENYEEAKFEKSNLAYQGARRRSYKVLGKFHAIMGLLLDILYLIGLVSGGLFLYYGKIAAGDYAAYLLYISVMISPIRTFMTIYEQLQDGLSGFRRFLEVMAIEEEKETANGKVLKDVKGNVVFDNVTFSYKKRENGNIDDNAVVKNINIDIPAGKTIALVGPSGGGKTTLCNLIPRFYEINSGKITIDGIDIKDVTRYNLRENIAIVSQDVFLFTGTIRDNIAYGRPDATDKEIEEAGRLANIDEFAKSLENGYDTFIGERGLKLSGGQKQRIAIARAFLKNPPILILDEATSALDNITEMQIQKALESLSEGRTTLVVAHRLSTVKNADKILVVTHNGIEEEGSHKQLLEQNGIYAELYNYQFENSRL